MPKTLSLKDFRRIVVPLRITEMPWWLGEHRNRVTPAALKRRNATSKSDCAACHPGAGRGPFDDD